MDLLKNLYWGEQRKRFTRTERICVWAVIAMFAAVWHLADEVRYLRLCVEGMTPAIEGTVLE